MDTEAIGVLPVPMSPISSTLRRFSSVRSMAATTCFCVSKRPVTGLPGAEQEYAGLDIIFRLKPCPPTELIALVRSCINKSAA